MIPYSEEFIGFGDDAIYNTVYKMRDIINISARNPYVRKWAQKILGAVKVNDKMGEAKAIFNFVRDNVRYTRDPKGFEYIQTPPLLLEDIGLYQKGQGERPIGDCDDMTVLGLSLLKSIGFPVMIKVVGFDPKKMKYSHVYGIVNVQGKWIPFDAVRPNSYLGWEAPNIVRAAEFKV